MARALDEVVPAEQTLAELIDVTKVFQNGQGTTVACDHISLRVRKGVSLGLVGESGSGKSTLARMLQRLERPTSGRILLNKIDVTHLPDSKMRPLRRQLQFVAQNPLNALFPNFTAEQNIAEPLYLYALGNRRERYERAYQLMEQTGLTSITYGLYPHELSGGQQQRVAIARALALSPQMLVLDEAVASLDVSTQAHILNLLLKLKEELQLTLLFISHNLAVVRLMCEEIAVMYRGRIVEMGDSDLVFQNPRHPYTRLLLSSIPAFTTTGVTPFPDEILLREQRELADAAAEARWVPLKETEANHWVAMY